MLTLVVFILVFGGMVFVHEFGHYLVARLFNIEVEEFGFGFPPRALRLWRARGKLVIGGQSVIIPANFDLPFDVALGRGKAVRASADRQDERLVLRSIELVEPQAPKASQSFWQSMAGPNDLELKSEYRQNLPPAPEKPANVMQRGEIEVNGFLTQIEQGTEFTLNALPLGGFVRPKGENDPSVPGGLAAANPWKRLAVLFAGPLMNLLTAVIVLSVVIAQVGISVPGTIRIEEVTADSPASQAGLQVGDLIKAVNGTPVSEVDATRTLIRSNLDKPITLLIERDGQELTVSATPLSSRSVEQGALGVALGYPTRPAGLLESIQGGLQLTGEQAAGIMYLPVALLRGSVSPQEAPRLVGLKGIYDFFGLAIQRDVESRAQAPQPAPQTSGGGAAPAPATPPSNYVLELIAMLSISLGVFNLFPIPALDGGRILFTLPEIIFRRRIPPHFENAVNGVAFFLLIGVMLFVNVMDFINPVKLP